MAAKEKRLTNWSANITYTSDVVHERTSIAEIQDLLKSKPKVKPFGTRHTFNFITDTLHCRISLKQLFPEEAIHLDPNARTVTISAGVRYDELCPYLHDRGFALSNLPSITELSVVGACSTGAHGSGDKCGSLATAVSALEIVTGDGEVVKLSRDADGDDVFSGAVVGLGALGVITKLTLDVEPQFTMRQWVYEGLPMEELTEHFEEIMACGYSVSLFTNWQGEQVHQMWVKLREDTPFSDPKTLFGAQRQNRPSQPHRRCPLRPLHSPNGPPRSLPLPPPPLPPRLPPPDWQRAAIRVFPPTPPRRVCPPRLIRAPPPHHPPPLHVRDQVHCEGQTLDESVLWA